MIRDAIRRLPLGLQLTLSGLLVLLIGMSVAAGLAWLAVERLYLDNQRRNLLAQAELTAATLQTQPLSEGVFIPSPYSQAANVAPGLHTRLIDPQSAAVISFETAPDPSGEVALPALAQNPASPVTAGELLMRPEISQALQGQPAAEMRRVAGGRRVLYAAAPVLSPDGRVAQIVYLATPLPETQWGALPGSLRLELLGALLVAGLIAALAGWSLARRIARPLAGLAEAALSVAGGDLQPHAPSDMPAPEMAVLGKAFDTMTAELRKADQVTTAFIADVTHELRTPLTVIKGTIETLQDGAIDDQEARGPFLESMDRETERLIRLVNDLLVLTRFDAGQLHLNLQTVDLAELARRRCAHFSVLAEPRQVDLRVVEQRAQDAPPAGRCEFCARGDPDRLAQVLDNLLDNAIRYTPPGGEIVVTLSRTDGEVGCEVSNPGPAIPAEQLPLIFERFYRLDPARDRGQDRQAGSGLGLAIVRSLVTAHGGEVSAASAPEQGVTISFWLPAA